MRLLHTSDWHLGRTFHGASLLADQEAVLGELAKIVVRENVDVVLVAGDIYDRAMPSAEAVQLANRVVGDLRDAGAQVIMTSGNHDSAQRLGAFAEFAEAGGLFLRTAIDRLDDPVRLYDEHGPVLFYGIPYLEPETARHILGTPDARDHESILTVAMQRIRDNIAQHQEKVRSVVLAHAFVIGGVGSESERSIAVGGVEHVPTAVFNSMDYVALGHLHGPQVLEHHIRYSGSPLAYSFSEARQHKSAWLVDFDANGLADIRRHMLPVPRKLATVSGTLDDLLTSEEYASLTDCYLSIVLTDEVRPIDAMRQLRERFSYAVHLDWQPEGGRFNTDLRYAEAVRGRTDLEIASNFLDDCRGALPAPRETELFHNALAAAHRETD